MQNQWPGQYPQQPPYPPQYPQQYEFNAAQNAVLGKLAARMRLAGIAQIVFAAMEILASCKIERAEGGGFSANGSSPFAIVLIICACFTLSAASSFSKIVATQGWDVSHLLVAVRSYSKALLVQFIAYVIMAVLVAIVLLLLALLLVFFAAMFASLMK